MAWRRKLFFLFEKLKITPAERKSVSILLVLLVLLATVNYFMEPSTPFDDEYYSGLKQEYLRRSSMLQQKEERLLARYDPGRASASDTIPFPDSLQKGRTEEEQNPVLRININTADAGTLQKLSGIGPVYAQRIIDYRNKHGLYDKVEDLLKIKGIGKKRLEKLKPFVKLNEETPKQ